MYLSFEWLLWQAALFLNFLSKHLGVNVKVELSKQANIIMLGNKC